MLNQVVEVVDPLDPIGTVTVKGELWRAVSESGETMQTGESVKVISMEGLALHVVYPNSNNEGTRGRG